MTRGHRAIGMATPGVVSLGVVTLLVASCGTSHRATVRSPQGPCVQGTHGGLASHALAWGSRGWGALTTFHGAVVLREYTPDGEARDEPVEVMAEATTDPRLALGWTEGAWVALVAPRNGVARVARVTPGGVTPGGVTPGVTVLTDRVTGDAAVVPWQGAAALFYGTGDGPRMVRVGDAMSVGAPRVCPDDLEPRAVTASGDHLVALVPMVDNRTGDGVGLDVLVLDGRCREVTRTHLWDGALNGRAHALAADGRGRVYVAFGDRDGAVWLAVVGEGGAVRVRARRVLPGGGAPRVTADEAGADVIAVRTDEAADSLVVTRVDTEGLLQRTQSVASAPSMDLLAVAPDPWGGALVGWTRPDPTGGAARTGTGRYSFVTRVCAERR